MTTVPPLTASVDIAKANKSPADSSVAKPFLAAEFGSFAKDVVDISNLAIEKQQQESQLQTTKEIEDIANDVIRVTSTIGRAKSVGNLTNTQATELYNKISSLL